MKKLTVLLISIVIVLAVGRPATAQSEGTIAGIVFLDADRDGVRDEGEEGLLDIEVNFSTAGWETTINTDGAGAFSIDLNPATWTVTMLVPEDRYVATTDTQLEILLETPGDAVTDIEFGLADLQAADDEGGEVLPESGLPVSEGMLIAGLIGLMGVGGVLVVVGQQRRR